MTNQILCTTHISKKNTFLNINFNIITAEIVFRLSMKITKKCLNYWTIDVDCTSTSHPSQFGYEGRVFESTHASLIDMSLEWCTFKIVGTGWPVSNSLICFLNLDWYWFSKNNVRIPWFYNGNSLIFPDAGHPVNITHLKLVRSPITEFHLHHDWRCDDPVERTANILYTNYLKEAQFQYKLINF